MPGLILSTLNGFTHSLLTITFYLHFIERHREVKPVAKFAQLISGRAMI